MDALDAAVDWDRDYDLNFIGDTPVCTHCHHYNLFIDKTIDDALGAGEGTRLRTEAAREFGYQLLGEVYEAGAIETADRRLEAAAELFGILGHGRLDFSQAGQGGGLVVGDPLHYSYSWLEKHGGSEDRYHPTDAVAAGFAAAALAHAYGHRPEAVEAIETGCRVLGEPDCRIELTLTDAEPPDERPAVDRQSIRELVPETFGGIDEAEVRRLSTQLREFLGGVAGDERGLIEAFGIFITTSPSSHYNRLSYSMLEQLEHQHPRYVEVSAGLLREAGRMCGFNTFGGIIGSPEWEAMTGVTEPHMKQVALHSTVIARALGFGRWSLADYEPDRLLTFRAPCTYEAPYCRLRHGEADSPACYLFEGACEAIAALGHAVDWADAPAFNPAFYEQMFQGETDIWTAEQSRCLCTGDDYCEVTVRKRG